MSSFNVPQYQPRTSRNTGIRVSSRLEVRAVFVSDPDGLTMHWIAAPRETRIHNPNEAAPAVGNAR